MALVRRTEKLRESIERQIRKITLNKITALLNHEHFVERVATFFNGCINDPWIFPSDIMGFIDKQGPSLANTFYGFNHPLVEVVIVEPLDPKYSWSQNYNCMTRITIPGELFPVIPVCIKPNLLWRDESDSYNAGISALVNESSSNHDEIRTKMVMSFHVPSFKEKEIENVYEFKRVDFCKKPLAAGRFHYSLNHAYMIKDAKKEIITSIDDQSMPRNELLIEQFLAFNHDQESFTRVITRYQKTREYIFGELWKLPSLNKMADFFPAIKAFLDDETLERLNKGAKKRKEYNVALPDEEAIAAATEASIKL